MKHTRAALLAGLTLTAASVGAFVPAHAADTTVTFELTSDGALEVSAPQAETLTESGGLSLLDQDTVSGTFSEPVTVVDERGSLIGGWTTAVSITDFQNGTGDDASVIAKENVRYATGVVSFNGVGVGAGVDALTSPVLGSDGTWSVDAVAVGNSTASWTPTIQVNLPEAGVAEGVYSATITHSVS